MEAEAGNGVKQLVRDRYGQEARRVLSGAAASGAGDAVPGDLYGEAAGFTGVEVQATRVYDEEEAREFLASRDAAADRLAPQVAGKVVSAFARAAKP